MWSRAEVVLSCWQFDAAHRPTIGHIISILVKNPTLIRPCLDSPSAALVLEGTASLEMSLAPKTRGASRNPRRASGDMWTRRGLSLSLSHDDDSKVSSDSPDPAMVSLMDPFCLRSGSTTTPPVPVVPRYCKTTAAPHNRVSFDSRIRTSMFSRSSSTDDRRGPSALVVSLGHDADDRCLDGSYTLSMNSAPVVTSVVPLTNSSQQLSEPMRQSPVGRLRCLNDDCLAPTSSLESRADSDYCSQHSKDFVGSHGNAPFVWSSSHSCAIVLVQQLWLLGVFHNIIQTMRVYYKYNCVNYLYIQCFSCRLARSLHRCK